MGKSIVDCDVDGQAVPTYLPRGCHYGLIRFSCGVGVVVLSSTMVIMSVIVLPSVVTVLIAVALPSVVTVIVFVPAVVLVVVVIVAGVMTAVAIVHVVVMSTVVVVVIYNKKSKFKNKLNILRNFAPLAPIYNKNQILKIN